MSTLNCHIIGPISAPILYIDKYVALNARWWTGRNRNASNDTPYGCCYVNLELQSYVLNVNTDIGGDETVSDRLRYGGSERVI